MLGTGVGELRFLAFEQGELGEHQALVGLDRGGLQVGLHAQHLERGERTPVLVAGAGEVLHADGDVADAADRHRKGGQVATAGDVGAASGRDGFGAAFGDFDPGVRQRFVGLTQVERQCGQPGTLRIDARLHRRQLDLRGGKLLLDVGQRPRRRFDFAGELRAGGRDVVDDVGQFLDAVANPFQLVLEVVGRRLRGQGGEKQDRNQCGCPQRAPGHFRM